MDGTLIEWPTPSEYLATMLSQLHNTAYYILTHQLLLALLIGFVVASVGAFVRDYGRFSEYDDPFPFEDYTERK